MLKLKRFARIPHAIFNSAELSQDAKIMMTYLVVRSNWFMCEECFFSVPRKLFNDDIGFYNHKIVTVREELIALHLIEIKRGGQGKATQYKINWENIETALTNRFKKEVNYEEECKKLPF